MLQLFHYSARLAGTARGQSIPGRLASPDDGVLREPRRDLHRFRLEWSPFVADFNIQCKHDVHSYGLFASSATVSPISCTALGCESARDFADIWVSTVGFRSRSATAVPRRSGVISDSGISRAAPAFSNASAFLR